MLVYTLTTGRFWYTLPMARFLAASVVAVLALPLETAAQTTDTHVQLGIHMSIVNSAEFDDTDVGIGGRLSWHPLRFVSVEAELTAYPSDFADAPAFSSSRVEALFGATVGPRLGRLRPFAKVRPGLVSFAEAPEPFACIAIFPPPLACALAAGDTVFAIDVGGGIEFQTSDRTFVRMDIGDRLVRYPAPVLDSDGTTRDEAFFSHDLRIQIGAGITF